MSREEYIESIHQMLDGMSRETLKRLYGFIIGVADITNLQRERERKR